MIKKIKKFYLSIPKSRILTLIPMVILFFAFSCKHSSSVEKGIKKEKEKSGLTYIKTTIENGSSLNWELANDSTVNIHLNYDYERNSLNRAYDHWHFLLEAKKGTDLTLVFHNFSEIYNGEKMPFNTWIMDCITSPDDRKWEHVPVEWIEGERMKVKIHMESDSLYIARVDPYRVSDLQNLVSNIEENELVKITPIGNTVEGRKLQIIQVGGDKAPHRIFIRARVHAWEPGGNWVVEGIIKKLLDNSRESKKYLENYTVYILPMANMDGVARGISRFNLNGMDLNRNLTAPADSILAPENAAMEKWLEAMIEKGMKPDLAIDFHNDSNGPLFFSTAGKEKKGYVENMDVLEGLLREHTWFSEHTSFFGTTSFEEGLMARYDIDALVYELNAHWIKGLNKKPLSDDWILLGGELCNVFDLYFKETK
ncbi:peptidase M14 [Maribacter polysiphoniae]|uniref:Peptidase M14 n=1 Tax=Maribacter polysiphoniae TaxID=429344 RepID=A0A316DWW2_9FLAO|nr:M14-type cytosolic carboxypeptidase [Maribacter polysiphoniae]MBD1261662.1 peptidase M14 [Maribacter polysiphoniae]PWK22534.1 zinc carboxypeptidase [Maribacter polysiphoniae]